MVVITAERLAQARAQVGPSTPSEPAPDGAGVVERAGDDAILYREALARGRGPRDPPGRFRLGEKMRFRVEGRTGTGTSGDDAVNRQPMPLGDPCPPGSRVRSQWEQDLTLVFGAVFARTAVALQPGGWVGPVRSAYGVQLVVVEARQPGGTPSLDAVRSRLVAQVREERHE